MKRIDVKFIAESAIIAALYAALTWLFAPISYGPIQFRISEILILLVVLNPKYSFSLIIGCFIANTTSSLGWYDMVFGTLATIVAIIPMCFIRKMPIAAIFPVLANAFIVSIELGLAFELWGGAYWYDVWTVGLGELVVLYFIGIPVMSALVKNDVLCELMALDQTKAFDINMTASDIVGMIVGLLGVILFIAYPMYSSTIDDSVVTYSTLSIANNGEYYLWISLGISVLYSVIYVLLKGKLKFILEIIIALGFVALYIIIGVNHHEAISYVYYYIYMIFPILAIGFPIFNMIRDSKNIQLSE